VKLAIAVDRGECVGARQMKHIRPVSAFQAQALLDFIANVQRAVYDFKFALFFERPIGGTTGGTEV